MVEFHSFLFALNNLLVFGVAFPAIMIFLNQYFHLPAYQNIFMQFAGILFIFIGCLIFIYCTKLFKILGKGTPVPIEPPKQLVAEKLYKYSRNPIYTGYCFALFGYFLLFGNFLLLIYFLLGVIGIHLYVVYIEEPTLKKRFGKSYSDYLKKVPRWL